jgi:ubiquinone/menaquinone biosynthesis C-methylase UbiE
MRREEFAGKLLTSPVYCAAIEVPQSQLFADSTIDNYHLEKACRCNYFREGHDMSRQSAAKWIKRVSPKVLRADLTAFVHDRVKESLKANAVVDALYTPSSSDAAMPLSKPGQRFTRQSIWRMKDSRRRGADQPLPVPPPELLYYGDTDRHLATGQSDSLKLRQLFDQLGLRLSGLSVLDWGCRDCRVLRHFAADARVCNFWGVDQDGTCIEWAKENLSPPFRFVTCSAYPHLPFEDRTFDVIVGISVFTHIVSLADAWLMELRRILVPGGYGLFTVHDEHTSQFLSENDEMRKLFELEHEDIASAAGADLVVVDGPELPSEYVNVFHSTARIQQEWGQYFEIVSIQPRAFYHQSMVVIRKPM